MMLALANIIIVYLKYISIKIKYPSSSLSPVFFQIVPDTIQLGDYYKIAYSRSLISAHATNFLNLTFTSLTIYFFLVEKYYN